ncbi:MAG: DMT family transporter [Rhodospirillales bacterium]|nr:DMT family transporter [Rhodospirillales bacterium]
MTVRPPTVRPESQSIAAGRGIAFMLLGGALLTMNDAVLKWLTGDYPVGQIMFMRGLFVFLPISILVYHSGGLSALRINSFRNQALRGGLMVTGTFLFITGLGHLPLGEAIAITFAGPLFITLLAPVLLGEHVGWRRWAAVLVGFSGILVMTRPGSEAVQWAAMFPLSASMFGALRDLMTRKLSTSETSISMLCFSTAIVVLGGLATLPFGWAPLTPRDVGLMALSGMLVGSAHFLLIECFRLAEAALVAPFKYFNMVWAVLFGFIIWGDIPDTWTITGAGFVICSVLYIMRREAQRKKRR